MKIIMYTKEGCSYCSAAKSWLRERGLNFEERNINDSQERKFLYEDINHRFRKNVRTMPQIMVFEDGLESHVGGYDELINSDLAKRAVTFNNLDF